MTMHRSFPPVMAAVLLWTALAVPTSAQQLLRTDTGPSGAGFGRAAPAGDVNGDGHDDLIVGAPLDDSGGLDAGRASVYSGSDGVVLFQFNGSGPGDLFGSSCAGAGDVDGDGHDDLIVGAPQTNVLFGRGYARLFSGASGAVLRTFTGAAAGDRFGATVAGAGDLNGDGRDDVLVGAPQHDGGGTDAGAVTAFSGANGCALYSTTGSSGDHLGISLGCDLPDAIKADDEPDVLIGLTMDGGSRAGAVQVRKRGDFSLRFTVTGQAGQRLGAQLAPAGDVNGDGQIDLLAATDPRDALGVPTAPAQVRLYSGSDGGVLRTFSDGSTGSGYGSALAALGDVSGDGVPDLGVGEPGHDGSGIDAGGVRIYSGGTGKTWYSVLGPAAGAGFGTSVAFAGDLNADGLPDCSVGSPAGSLAAGRVYSMSVTRWEEIGNGLPGIAGIPRLTGEGGLVASVEASLTLTGAPSGTLATLVLGFSLVVDPSTNTLVPSSDVVVPGLLTDTDGTLVFSFTWPAGVPSGSTIYHQFRITDATAPLGQSRSNTVAALVP
jgi:hypothetical protein